MIQIESEKTISIVLKFNPLELWKLYYIIRAGLTFFSFLKKEHYYRPSNDIEAGKLSQKR